MKQIGELITKNTELNG